MFQKIKENIEGFIETRIELIKLDIEERISTLLLKLAKLIVITATLGLCIFFLSIGLAQILNTFLESRFWGYIILSGFYLTITLILFYLKDEDGLILKYFSSKIKTKIDEGKL